MNELTQTLTVLFIAAVGVVGFALGQWWALY